MTDFTPNENPKPVLGCDIAKDNIVAYASDQRTHHTFRNNKTGIKSLIRLYPDHIIALEVTGGYEALLAGTACNRGQTVYRIHPARIAAFIKATGQQAKTDPLDAQAIARFTLMHSTRLRPFSLPSPAQKALTQLSRRREELIAMRTREKARLKAPDMIDICQKSFKNIIKTLSKEIEKVEDMIAGMVAKDEHANRVNTVLRSIPGIGQVTAHRLITLMPELGHLTGKEITSLGGLAPFARQSGNKNGYRRTGRGRREIRQTMFMAALSATRYNKRIKAFYDRLIDNGKKPMTAIIAAARKLLVIANAKVRDEVILKQS